MPATLHLVEPNNLFSNSRAAAASECRAARASISIVDTTPLASSFMRPH
jgi:hypothetical protein